MLNLQFDPNKDAANLAKHGLSLADAAQFDFAAAVITVDDRHDYGEIRYRAFAEIDGQGRCLVFTVIDDGAIRAVSYRRARAREMKPHGF